MPYLVQGAALVPTTSRMLSTGQLRRSLIILTAVSLAFTLMAIQAPAPTEAAGTDAARVVAYAKTHLGKRFRMGAEGLRYFDCSGLVYRVYLQAGVLNKVGGSRKLAAGYYRWFKERGLLGRSNPKAGDLIWWTKGGRITHMGLYAGNSRAISALVNPYGVRSHSINGISVRFLAFGHANISR